jgi:hypothetical protein
MKFLIVIDSTANSGPRRSYLCRLPKCWVWTEQRREAAEFASRKDAQQIINTTMRIKTGVRIVPVGEDLYNAAD